MNFDLFAAALVGFIAGCGAMWTAVWFGVMKPAARKALEIVAKEAHPNG